MQKGKVRARAGLASALVAATILSGLLAPSGANADPSDYPNMTPLPPYQIALLPRDGGPPTDQTIRLSLTDRNLGLHALDVIGVPTSTTTALALQCTLWAYRVCLLREPVGNFSFHPSHGHWHFDDYALYELRLQLPDGSPDYSPAGLAATGTKVSFCLMDTYQVAPPPEPSTFLDNRAFYASCPGVLQGISPGWADIYGSRLSGQQIIIAGVPDGDYTVVATVNFAHRILESTYDDNTSFTKVKLGTNSSGRRTILVG